MSVVIWHMTYNEEHSMAVEKRNYALLVILSEWQELQCCIEGISLPETTEKKTHVNKWVKYDDKQIQRHQWFGCGTRERKANHPEGNCQQSCYNCSWPYSTCPKFQNQCLSSVTWIVYPMLNSSKSSAVHWYRCAVTEISWSAAMPWFFPSVFCTDGNG